jgi:hypothetical protein
MSDYFWGPLINEVQIPYALNVSDITPTFPIIAMIKCCLTNDISYAVRRNYFSNLYLYKVPYYGLQSLVSYRFQSKSKIKISHGYIRMSCSNFDWGTGYPV